MTGAAAGFGGRSSISAGARAERDIAKFRRHLAVSIAMLVMLAAANAFFTPFFPWIVIPALAVGITLARELSELWRQGIRVGNILAPSTLKLSRPAAGVLAPATSAHLTGYGRAAVAAEASRREIEEIVHGLPEGDRALIPDVMPTVDRLVERVNGLAGTLERLDAAVEPAAAAKVETRIRELQHSLDERLRERTLPLLARQRDSILELMERRTTMLSQLESASLSLQSLRLELVKLRSAGIESGGEDVTSATREARALAREIGHALDAAAEIRSIRSEPSDDERSRK